MNTAGLTTAPDPAVAVDSVAVKTTAQSDAWVDGFDLFAAPLGTASWNQLPGGIDAGGCHDGNDNGFFCEDWIGAGVGAPVGGTLVFLWTGLVDPSDLQTGFLDASIKARFVNADGEKTGDLLSEGITLQPGPLDRSAGSDSQIPEPATLLFLGSGLSALGRSASPLRQTETRLTVRKRVVRRAAWSTRHGGACRSSPPVAMSRYPLGGSLLCTSLRFDLRFRGRPVL